MSKLHVSPIEAEIHMKIESMHKTPFCKSGHICEYIRVTAGGKVACNKPPR